MGEISGRASLDEQLSTVAHATRRRFLLALLEENSIYVAAAESYGSGDETDGRDSRVVMHHAHLPKLDDAGYIEWNRESHRVTKGPQFREIEPLLRILEDYREELADA